MGVPVADYRGAGNAVCQLCGKTVYRFFHRHGKQLCEGCSKKASEQIQKPNDTDQEYRRLLRKHYGL